MKVLVLKESAEGERRVAAVPATVEKMARAGMEVLVQAGAGLAAGFVDAEYQTAGAKVAGDLAGDVLLRWELGIGRASIRVVVAVLALGALPLGATVSGTAEIGALVVILVVGICLESRRKGER